MRPALLLSVAFAIAATPAAAQEAASDAPPADDAASADAAPAPDTPPTPAPANQPAPAPKKASGPMRMIVLDLKGGGLEASQLSSLTSFVTVSLSDYPQFEVLSGADVRAMVEFEGEKQAIGCSDDTSCLAEVAGAMGARLVVFGNMSKLGAQYLLNINLFDSEEGRAVGRTAIRGTSLDGVLAEVPNGTYKLVQPFLAKQGHDVEAPDGSSVVSAAEPAVADAPPSEGGGFPLLAIAVPTAGLVIGGGLVAGGVAADLLLPSSTNKKVDGGDFIAPVLYGAGGLVAVGSLVAIPFLLE